MLRARHRITLAFRRCLLPPRNLQARIGRLRLSSARPRVHRFARSKIRLVSRDRFAGTCLREHRTTGEGRTGLPRCDPHLDAVGDLLELRHLPRLAKAKCRSTRVGPEDSSEEAQHAELPAEKRAALVPEGKSAVKEGLAADYTDYTD